MCTMACCFTKEMRIIHLISRQQTKLRRQTWVSHLRKCSSSSATQHPASNSGNQSSNKDLDPLPVYLDPNVKRILTNITGIDPSKAARLTQVETPQKPVYNVISEKELTKLQEDALKKMIRRIVLQRPPFMKEREPVDKVISRDPEIAPILDSKLVMVDTSAYTQEDRDKLITVRETDGTLRHATHEERDRMLQLFFPKQGRTMFPASLFQPRHLKAAMNQGKYEYILERACGQYEPDNPEYITVTSTVYEFINKNGDFDQLRSTRHFAPMAFYFAWNNKIELLLMDMLKHELLLDAADLVKLHHIIHHKEFEEETDSMKLVKDFLEKYAHSEHRAMLELHIQSYEDRNQTQDVSANMQRRQLLNRKR